MSSTEGQRSRWSSALAAALLVLAIVLAFSPVADNGFVSFDDPGYILDNGLVQDGLDWHKMGRAFSATRMANWHPVTWLSHMLDVELFGESPAGHHLMSVALHALNALLLMAALRALGGRLWTCALAAALFALHPLRVESVAWASERKDILAGTFWMLTIWAHVAYVKRPSPRRYGLLLLAFALGLMSKQMLVTLPIILLLLDHWPLGRTRSAPADGDSPPVPWSRLVLEKLPLLLMSLGAGLATLFTQDKAGALKAESVIPLASRLAQAPVAGLSYLGTTLWPVDLAFFYPHPGATTTALAWRGAAALGVLLLVSALVYRRTARQCCPWWALGWSWYLIALMPVIGLAQVGAQASADRYTYLPLIGLAVACAWTTESLARRGTRTRSWAWVTCWLLVLGVLIVATREQSRVWRDNETLYSHALVATDDNYLAHTMLGADLLERGELDRAQQHLREAVRLRPSLPQAQYDLGATLLELGQDVEAEQRFRETLRLQPDRSEAHNNLGVLLTRARRYDEALVHLRQAVQSDSRNSAAQANLKVVRKLRRDRQAKSSGDAPGDPPSRN
jgi:hypothetical protein